LFDRPDSGGERAVLVHILIGHQRGQPGIEEFAELARSAGIQTVATITGSRPAPDSAHFAGSGKVEEIRECVVREQADVVLFNHELTPSQERNLEKALQCRVVGRTGVILDIFAQRARTFEGKLQVELAQLQHIATRLVRGWTHLERQRGGIGLRGPGETQLETDRRLIADKIKLIQKRLEKVQRQRGQNRRARQRSELPTIALAGYTNAGKSTLFNRLASASVYVANQLFATLDPTLRRIELPNKTAIILADTVGFIQHLPHKLVAAFHATLEETVQADAILHVVDASDPLHLERIAQVNEVLAEIGAADARQILVYNKIDQIADAQPRLDRAEVAEPPRVWLSALSGAGMEFLQQALMEALPSQMQRRCFRLPPQAGQIRARLHALGRVLREHFAENGDCVLELELEDRHFQQLCGLEPSLAEWQAGEPELN
jgi:GTP-binding protein HflX